MTDDASSEKPGLIWERLLQPVRSSQAGLDRERIVQTALAVADIKGLEAVSMRRVATELGSSAMSLYRHVNGKDDLLDLMLDEVFGEITLSDQSHASWYVRFQMLGHETRTVFKRHPWLSTLLNSRPTLGPNYLRWFEYSLAAAAPLGLEVRTVTQMIGALYAFVGGFVSYELAEEENTRRTGLTEQDKRAYVKSYVEKIISSGQYPVFARYFTEEVTVDPDRSFSFGLDCLLQGFAARLSLHGPE